MFLFTANFCTDFCLCCCLVHVHGHCCRCCSISRHGIHILIAGSKEARLDDFRPFGGDESLLLITSRSDGFQWLRSERVNGFFMYIVHYNEHILDYFTIVNAQEKSLDDLLL